MHKLLDAALELEGMFESEGWRYCIIGGLALIRWGEPRLTRDVDVTLLTGFGNEEHFIDELLRRFDSRITDSKKFALRNRVLLLKAANGIPLDIAMGGLPYEQTCVERSTGYPFRSDATLRTCSAEDLVVLKAFASRPQDWIDISGILIRQGNELDWTLIFHELAPLSDLKEDTSIIPRLEELRGEFDV